MSAGRQLEQPSGVDQCIFRMISGIERIARATISHRTSSWPKLVQVHIVWTVRVPAER